MLPHIFFHNHVWVPEMLNTFEEFVVTEMRTFKHEPFFLLGAEGGGGLICCTLRYNDGMMLLNGCKCSN